MHNIDENKVLRDALSRLNEDVPPMPEGLHAAWMQKVEDDMEENRTSKTRNLQAITRFLAVAAALVFIVGGTLLTRDDLVFGSPDALTGGAAQLAATYDYGIEEDSADGIPSNGAVYAASTMAAGSGNSMTFTRARTMDMGTEAGVPTEKAAPTEKKIIRSASLTLRTQEFDQSYANLRALCEAAGGWIESSSESVNSRTGLRTAYLTLRIPQSELDSYLVGTSDWGRITSRSETATDVTASYQDTQTRLNTQLALMDRLQALITESASLSDLLALEAQIADTQYQIDMLTSSLAETDRQVSYSTVNITLYEETAPELTDTTVSLGDRLLAGLKLGFGAALDFAQDMLVFLVAALPFIAIVAIVVIVAVVIRRIKRRHA